MGPQKYHGSKALCLLYPMDKLTIPGLCYHGNYILVGETITQKLQMKQGENIRKVQRRQLNRVS